MSAEEIIPPERDVKDYKFQQLCKVQVRDPVGPAEINGLYALIQNSSKFGLTFVGIDKGFKVIRTTEFITEDAKHATDRLQHVVTDIPTIATIDVGKTVTNLGISCDGLTLAVAVTGSDGRSTMLVYDVRRFVEPITSPVTPFLDINLGGGEAVTLRDMVWNPTQPSLLATCMSNGQLDMFDIKEHLGIKASLKAAKAKCVCWSPKGRQMVAGTEEGKLVQYDPDLNIKRTWDYPPLFPDASFSTISIVWLSTYTFLVGYLSSNADSSDQPNLILINGSKDQPPTHENFEDICFGTGEERPKKYFFNFLQQWDMVIAGSSNASEIAVMAKHLDQKQTWERWNLDDAARAECPLTEDYVDTYPLGMTIDFSSQISIPLGDERIHPPSPLMLILSTAGYIIPYHCMYMHKDALQITAPPEALSSAGCRQSAAGSAPAQAATQPFGGASTAAKNLFGTGPSMPKPTFGMAAQPPTSADTTAKPAFGAALGGGGQTETNTPFSGFGLGTSQKESQPAYGAKPTFATGPADAKPALFSGTPSSSFSFGGSAGAAKPSGFTGLSAPQTTAAPFTAAATSSAPLAGFGSFASATSATSSAPSAGFGSFATSAASNTAPVPSSQPPAFGGSLATSAQKPAFSASSTAPASSFSFGAGSGQSSSPAPFGGGPGTPSASAPFSAAGSASGPSPFTAKPASSNVTDAIGTKFSTSSMTPSQPFSFTTKSSGPAASGFNFSSTPTAAVVGSKPTPAPAQTTPALPPQTNLFAKPVAGPQSVPINSVPVAQSTGPSVLAGGFNGSTATIGLGKGGGLLPTPASQPATTGQMHKSATLASLTQATEQEPTKQGTDLAPPPPYPGSVSTTTASERETASPSYGENNLLDTVDKTFAKSIQEEIQHFEKEMAELRSRVGKMDYKIGRKDEMIQLKTKTDGMGKFCEEIKKTVQEQNKDVEEHTTLCLDMFAMVEECRMRQQLNSDPKYKSMLKSRALDSASAEKLQTLQLQNQALDQGLRDVDLILDSQWGDYQNRKKNKAKRVQAPTNDAIYRVVKTNHNLILAQKNKLKELEENLKQLKLYNKTSAWNNSVHSTGDRNDVLSSLAESLVEPVSSSSQRSLSPQRSSESGSIRGSKLAQLREHLCRRHVPVVRSTKPENLSMSRLTAPDVSVTRPTPRSPQEAPPELRAQQQQPASLRGPATATGAPSGFAWQSGTVNATGKREQSQAFNVENKPAATLRPLFTAVEKKNGSMFAVTGKSTLGFPQQPAPTSAGGFLPGFQGYGVRTRGPPVSQPSVPNVTEVNGIRLEDITPSGSDPDLETSEEEEEEYDEEEDSSESNGVGGPGFGLQFGTAGQPKPAGAQATSTPTSFKFQPEATTPKAPTAGSTPVSRNLFGQGDSKPSGGSFQFGAPGNSSGFGLGKSTATGSSAPNSGSGFTFTPAGKADTTASTQPKPTAYSGFNFGGEAASTFSFDTGSADSKPGLTGLFGSQGAGTGDSKTFTFAALASATNSPPPSIASDTSTQQTATSSVTSATAGLTVTGSDILSGSTSDPSSPAPPPNTAGNKPSASVSGFTATTASAPVGFGFGAAGATQSGFGSGLSASITQASVPLSTTTSAGSAGQDGKATTGPFASLTTAAASSAPSTGTTGLFGKGTSQAGSSATTSVLGQPTPASSTTDPKPATPQTAASTQPSTFSFAQPVTTTQLSAFSFSQSGTVTQASSSGFGQTASVSAAGGGESPGLFGKPATISSDGGSSLFGQTATTTTSSLFGQTSGSGGGLFGTASSSTTTSLFGQTATPTSSTGLFGSTPSSGTGLFGAATTTTSTGLFGSTATTTPGTGLFGAGATTTSSTGLFGAPSASTATSSGPFGSSTTSGTGMFGSAATTSSGTTGGFGASSGTGTGLFGSATTTTSSGFFGTTPSSGSSGAFGGSSFGQSTFGQSPGFGQSTSSSSSTFGQTGSSSGGLFGQPANEGSGGGFFGGLGGKPSAEKANTNVFGTGTFGAQSPASSSGLFGSSSTSTFGTAATSPGGGGAFSGGGAGVGSTGFGGIQQPTSGGGFGSSAFGGAPAFGGSPAFGATPSFGSSPSGFGSAPTVGGGGFGSQPTFGSASPLGAGGGTFGSAGASNPSAGFAGFASAGSPTFGALAQNTDAPSFGALNPSGTAGTPGGGFGSPAFGGGQQQQQQQQPPAFGGGGGGSSPFGSSPQFTGYRG